VAQPQAALRAGVARRGDDLQGGAGLLDVERQLEVGTHGLVEIGEGGDVLRQLGSRQLGDGPAAEAPAHDAVVVEHGVPVAGEPHVALEAGGAEADGQAERVEGILGRVGPRSSVGEPDGRTQRRMAGHPTSMPSPTAIGAWPPGRYDHVE
jgi:hypothetical protein